MAMNREQAEMLLAQYIFDDLDEATHEQFRAYLETDESLREQVTDMRLAAGLIGQASPAQEAGTDSDGDNDAGAAPRLSDKARRQLLSQAAKQSAESRWVRRSRSWWRMAKQPLEISATGWAVRIAALLLLGVLGWSLFMPALGRSRHYSASVARDAAPRESPLMQELAESDGVDYTYDNRAADGKDVGRGESLQGPSPAPAEEAGKEWVRESMREGEGRWGGVAGEKLQPGLAASTEQFNLGMETKEAEERASESLTYPRDWPKLTEIREQGRQTGYRRSGEEPLREKGREDRSRPQRPLEALEGTQERYAAASPPPTAQPMGQVESRPHGGAVVLDGGGTATYDAPDSGRTYGITRGHADETVILGGRLGRGYGDVNDRLPGSDDLAAANGPTSRLRERLAEPDALAKRYSIDYESGGAGGGGVEGIGWHEASGRDQLKSHAGYVSDLDMADGHAAVDTQADHRIVTRSEGAGYELNRRLDVSGIVTNEDSITAGEAPASGSGQATGAYFSDAADDAKGNRGISLDRLELAMKPGGNQSGQRSDYHWSLTSGEYGKFTEETAAPSPSVPSEPTAPNKAREMDALSRTPTDLFATALERQTDEADAVSAPARASRDEAEAYRRSGIIELPDSSRKEEVAANAARLKKALSMITQAGAKVGSVREHEAPVGDRRSDELSVTEYMARQRALGGQYEAEADRELMTAAPEPDPVVILGGDVDEAPSEILGDIDDESWRKPRETQVQAADRLSSSLVDRPGRPPSNTTPESSAPAPLPPASSFNAPPVNPWTMTEKDRLATFSIDVDTASYTLCRRYIYSGYRPPAGAVRMEEFVNYFDYNYPQQAQRVFNIHSESAWNPFARPGNPTALLKVGIKGKVIGRDGRKPAHLVFVVDTSGSMARADRLPMVKRAMAMLISQLNGNDRLSLVTYGERARLLLQAAPIRDSDRIIKVIEDLQAGGSTNLFEGLKLGYAQARASFVSGQINRVILCSDGVANLGQTEADAMVEHVTAYRTQGIRCTTVGFGHGAYNDELMEKLANKGDGSYVFVDSLAEAHRVFVEELAATLQTIARDVKIQVQFNPDRVRRYRLIGYENRDIADKDFRNDAIDAGEVGSGQSATALFEIEPIGRADDARWADLGTVFVRYRDVDTDKVSEIEQRIEGERIEKLGVDESPRFQLAACAATFAEVLRQSPHAAHVNLQQVQRVIDQVSANLPLDQRAAELGQLIRQAQGLPPAP